MNVNQNKGFSLIELMVVVAIIGILATVAVPNFMSFQAKAKQSSAKVELSSIYTAQQAFFISNQSYHGYLSYIGYVPDSCTNAGVCAGNNRLYATGFAAAGITAEFQDAPTDGKRAFRYPGNAPGAPNAVSGTQGASRAFATSFNAGATGVIRNGAGNDVWQINEDKILRNSRVGY
jgi:type IV pilus assembly protein PilA